MKRLIHTLGSCLLLLALAACGSKVNEVNKANFDKIKYTMTKQEVIAILGEPTESFDEVSRGVWGKWQKLNWKNDKTGVSINIEFQDGKAAKLGYFKIKIELKE